MKSTTLKSCDDMANYMTGKLKIGFVFDDSLDKPDGVQQYVLSLGKWLSSEGHDVHYLVGQTTRRDIKKVYSLSRNIQVTFNGNKLSVPLPTNRQKLAKLLNDENFDVLHVQMPYSPWLAHRLIMAAPATTKIVGTFHIVAYSGFVKLATKALALWTRQSMKRFSTIVSVSSAAQSYALETYGIETDIMPNVFDYSRFNEARPAQSDKLKQPNVLFLGRLVERKGCQYLIQAVRILKDKGVTDFSVTICGKGDLMPILKTYVEKHNLNVQFAGFVSEVDKPSIYAGADIAVFPSTGGESFGIVLVEAMASGRTAVLAGDNSGYASVMVDRPELLFPVKNADALADKLDKLLSDKTLRRDVATWGKGYSQKFDVTRVGRDLLRVYNK